MKKMILLCAAAIMAFGASAQMSLVKDLAKKAGSNDANVLMSVLEEIQPALTNPESANDALTWFTAGKSAIGLYNQLSVLKSMDPSISDELIQTALLEGFDYLEKALPLDSVVETNKDGSIKYNSDGSKKVKTKYSKNIIDLIKSNSLDLLKLGDQNREASNWAAAAEAYGRYVSFVGSPVANASGFAIPDSTLSEIIFLQGFSQFFGKSYQESYDNLMKAIKMGYNQNDIKMYKNAALEQLILDNINNEKYDAANKIIDSALSEEPNMGWLYLFKALSKEMQTGNMEEAFDLYKKAVEIEPNHAQSQYYYARAIASKADDILNAKENEFATTAQLMPKIKPFYEEALVHLKKAIELNPDYNDAKIMIEKINYLLYGE